MEQNNLIQLIYIHRTRITFTLRDRFLSASAIDFKIENRIFEPNNNGQKQPKWHKYFSMESHQPYLSFLFLTFLNKQGNFTFLPSVLSPVSKSNIKEVPWNHQNIHNFYSVSMKNALINQKRVSTFFYLPFSWVLTIRNVWVGSRTDIVLKPKSFRDHFLLIPPATQSMIK